MRRVVIDTDPGQDDAVALLTALASPDDLDVVGITTVAGNVPLARTTENALKVVELSGRGEVPVSAGADRPMIRPLVTAEYVHGASGLDGIELPSPTLTVDGRHAVDRIVEAASEPLTICTLGPLTNVAQALATSPRIARNVEEIVMMGGGFSEGGNVTPVAEFNVYVDPHAAEVVLGAGVPITMMPLDVTHQVLASEHRMARFEGLGTRPGEVVAAWLRFFERFDADKYGTDGAPLHDPCVIAYLLEPDLFDGRLVNVEVETSSPLTLGMTVVDWWGVSGRPVNATVMRAVDADAFFELLIDRIGRL